ncbi:MAG: sugar phosphate nucleotidyltransferase [Candidatus Aenigmatarchaeota archaeon]
MIKSIIHAGGESTRIKELFNGPKALAPIEGKPLLWFHLQPLLKSNKIKEYIFTLRHQHEIVKEYLEKLKAELKILANFIIEPKPLGRAGVIRYGIENKVIDLDVPYLMSHPDDLIPININKLIDYASEAERKGKSLIMVMARYTQNPFGVGIAKKSGNLLELESFKEKPELPLIEGHYANTGVMLFLPEAMKEFKNVSLDKLTHPEHEIIPKLAKQKKIAIFLVDKWISVNYASDYKSVLEMGSKKLLDFLKIY